MIDRGMASYCEYTWLPDPTFGRASRLPARTKAVVHVDSGQFILNKLVSNRYDRDSFRAAGCTGSLANRYRMM
jgi:hypothetical protein